MTQRSEFVLEDAAIVGAAVTDSIGHPFQQRRRLVTRLSCGETRYSAHSVSNLARGDRWRLTHLAGCPAAAGKVTHLRRHSTDFALLGTTSLLY